MLRKQNTSLFYDVPPNTTQEKMTKRKKVVAKNHRKTSLHCKRYETLTDATLTQNNFQDNTRMKQHFKFGKIVAGSPNNNLVYGLNGQHFQTNNSFAHSNEDLFFPHKTNRRQTRDASDRNPWGKPGSGAPNNFHQRSKQVYKMHAGSKCNIPLGKPGAGAPLRTDSGRVNALLFVDPEICFQKRCREQIHNINMPKFSLRKQTRFQNQRIVELQENVGYNGGGGNISRKHQNEGNLLTESMSKRLAQKQGFDVCPSSMQPDSTASASVRLSELNDHAEGKDNWHAIDRTAGDSKKDDAFQRRLDEHFRRLRERHERIREYKDDTSEAHPRTFVRDKGRDYKEQLDEHFRRLRESSMIHSNQGANNFSEIANGGKSPSRKISASDYQRDDYVTTYGFQNAEHHPSIATVAVGHRSKITNHRDDVQDSQSYGRQKSDVRAASTSQFRETLSNSRKRFAKEENHSPNKHARQDDPDQLTEVQEELVTQVIVKSTAPFSSDVDKPPSKQVVLSESMKRKLMSLQSSL